MIYYDNEKEDIICSNLSAVTVKLYVITLTLVVGQTSYQQNKDTSATFLNAEGGGATRPCK